MLAALVRKIGSSRLVLPEPPLAWILLVVGVLLVAIGTAGVLRVRRRMGEEAEGMLGHLLMRGRGTLSYLIHDYDGQDRGIIFLGLFGRVIGGIVIVWGLAGLIWP
ncbi:MAG TPA: hypothetical protein PLL78_07650 [Fimbriimonadaceae bacterium]|nr:hypothetical protein [Fimbriimonadaceae bacterium]HRJ96548.1 hypothetical protein [Fimbriimonadaceae bacterium]